MIKTPTYAIHNDKEIKGFFGDYRWLSNFWEANGVVMDRKIYRCVEGAYQAAKTTINNEREPFREMIGSEAKKEGHKLKIREDWEKIKYDIMAALVFSKFFRSKDLRKQLLETGDRYLEETNTWRDLYWGCNPEGEGENNLGKILMKVREFWK